MELGATGSGAQHLKRSVTQHVDAPPANSSLLLCPPNPQPDSNGDYLIEVLSLKIAADLS